MFQVSLQSEQPCAIADDLLRGGAVCREYAEIERALAFGKALAGCVVDEGRCAYEMVTSSGLLEPSAGWKGCVGSEGLNPALIRALRM